MNFDQNRLNGDFEQRMLYIESLYALPSVNRHGLRRIIERDRDVSLAATKTAFSLCTLLVAFAAAFLPLAWGTPASIPTAGILVTVILAVLWLTSIAFQRARKASDVLTTMDLTDAFADVETLEMTKPQTQTLALWGLFKTARH